MNAPGWTTYFDAVDGTPKYTFKTHELEREAREPGFRAPCYGVLEQHVRQHKMEREAKENNEKKRKADEMAGVESRLLTALQVHGFVPPPPPPTLPQPQRPPQHTAASNTLHNITIYNQDPQRAQKMVKMSPALPQHTSPPLGQGRFNSPVQNGTRPPTPNTGHFSPRTTPIVQSPRMPQQLSNQPQQLPGLGTPRDKDDHDNRVTALKVYQNTNTREQADRVHVNPQSKAYVNYLYKEFAEGRVSPPGRQVQPRAFGQLFTQPYPQNQFPPNPYISQGAPLHTEQLARVHNVNGQPSQGANFQPNSNSMQQPNGYTPQQQQALHEQAMEQQRQRLEWERAEAVQRELKRQRAKEQRAEEEWKAQEKVRKEKERVIGRAVFDHQQRQKEQMYQQELQLKQQQKERQEAEERARQQAEMEKTRQENEDRRKQMAQWNEMLAQDGTQWRQMPDLLQQQYHTSTAALQQADMANAMMQNHHNQHGRQQAQSSQATIQQPQRSFSQQPIQQPSPQRPLPPQHFSQNGFSPSMSQQNMHQREMTAPMTAPIQQRQFPQQQLQRPPTVNQKTSPGHSKTSSNGSSNQSSSPGQVQPVLQKPYHTQPLPQKPFAQQFMSPQLVQQRLHEQQLFEQQQLQQEQFQQRQFQQRQFQQRQFTQQPPSRQSPATTPSLTQAHPQQAALQQPHSPQPTHKTASPAVNQGPPTDRHMQAYPMPQGTSAHKTSQSGSPYDSANPSPVLPQRAPTRPSSTAEYAVASSKPTRQKPPPLVKGPNAGGVIPQKLQDLVIHIKTQITQKQGMPERKALKYLKDDFNVSSGFLKAGSELGKFFGDERMFSHKEWQYLRSWGKKYWDYDWDE